MGIGSIEEKFFLKSINVERVFEFVERSDYFFIYNIKECIKKSDCPDGVYLSELAELMELPITKTSKAVKHLEDMEVTLLTLSKIRQLLEEIK